jgi:hypothetical protein
LPTLIDRRGRLDIADVTLPINWDSTAMNPEPDRDPRVVGQVTTIGSTPPTAFEAAGQASRNWPLTCPNQG